MSADGPDVDLLKDEDGAPFPEAVQRAHRFAVQVVISDLIVAQLRDEERIAAEAEKRGAEELQRRIDVALAWHNPVESQYRDADGNVTRTVTECIHCSTLTDDGVDWPCATVRALGAQPGHAVTP